MDVEIGVASTDADRDAIYRLRYEVYVEELGIYAEQADRQGRRLCDDIDATARLIYARVGSDILGTIRLHLRCDAPLPETFVRTYELERFVGLVPLERIGVMTRFMVARGHRGSSIPFQLIVETARQHLEAGLDLTFCDCEPHLVAL